uniref:Uncharacterized protein n=1 Tax=Tetradesmus obliquus TaxID=3088 RepID=A0A383VVP7_TETOB|eukprot:jgi/Sobl393_1/9088/SZX68980.1
MLQFATTSNPDAEHHAVDVEEFHKLGAWLASAYTDIWQHFQVEQLGSGSLSFLLTWRGSQQQLRPVLFISHTDVVPVTAETLQDWRHPPFSGAVADGAVWGRGAQDVKVGVVSLLEAALALLRQGFQPARSLLFAFGHDEEVGGDLGAVHIAELLASRGVQLEMIVDEGIGLALAGVAPFTKQPVALVGTAEKQLQTVQVTVQSPGGHSSKPPIDGSTVGGQMGRLMAAVSAQPPPTKLVSPTREFMIAMADLAPAWLSLMLLAVKYVPFAGRLLAKMVSMASEEAAAVQSRPKAVTLAAAGVADNVLPQSGSVTINFRLLPGDTPQTALQLTRGWLGRDAAAANISMKGDKALQPMAVADASGPHFAIMQDAIQAAWRLQGPQHNGKALPVVPMLLPAMTDSRHYARLSPNGALRWSPGTFGTAGGELNRIHGTNERMRIADFACGLLTYEALLRSFGSFGAEAVQRAGEAAGRRPLHQQQQQQEL